MLYTPYTGDIREKRCGTVYVETVAMTIYLLHFPDKLEDAHVPLLCYEVGALQEYEASGQVTHH